METTKPWYLSAGVWGAIVSVVASVLAMFKVRIDPALLADVRDWVLSLVAVAGGAVALYGRLRASRRIALAGAGQPGGAVTGDAAASGPGGAAAKQNWKLNAAPLALLLPALLSQASGCQALSALQPPPAAYVASDRATFEAVAPEYAAYVQDDPNLDEAERARRARTIESWRVRVEAGEQAAK